MLHIDNTSDLMEYLRYCGYLGASASPRVTVLHGGVSNRTIRVDLPDGQSWVIKQALPKLRVETEWLSDPARIHVEALGRHWLEKLLGDTLPHAVPQGICEDQSSYVFAMRAVPQPHRNWKEMLLQGQLHNEHIEQFAELIATVHCRSYAQRDELADVFDNRSFFDSLRLEPYYRYTARQVPETCGFMNQLIEQTLAQRVALTHGDYSPKNILVRDHYMVLLDHEVIHFGDPAFDVGFALTHFLSKAHHVANRRDDFAAASHHYWQCYAQRVAAMPWVDGFEQRVVRHTLGCLLARVAGRSPLEYLDAAEKQCQRALTIRLMEAIPLSVDQLVDQFVKGL
jgi:5-methylthioribose kinase